MGIDGCRGGWLIATATASASRVERWPEVTVTVTGIEVVARLRDRLAVGAGASAGTSSNETGSSATGSADADDGSWLAAIDMPIGLLDVPTPGGRECDRAARRLLGPRRSSVFSPPIRPALAATSYADAKVRNGGMTVQTWNIVARIGELDTLLATAPSLAMHESHPELAFMRLANGRALAPKRTAVGRSERTALLAEHLPGAAAHLHGPSPRGAAPDDVCDALVLCLTAGRIAAGSAQRVPQGPIPTDARHLPMLVWW